MTKREMLELLFAEGERLAAEIDTAVAHVRDGTDVGHSWEQRWMELLAQQRHNSHILRLVIESR